MRTLFVLFCLLHSVLLFGQDHMVYFESAKYTLSQQERVALDSFLHLLDPSKSYKVEIIGHTDSIGGIKRNQILSKKRANQVQLQFNKLGLSAAVSILWKAHFSPAQSNASEEGKARNRRVEINCTAVIPQKDIWDMPVQEFQLSASKAYLLHTQNGCKLTIRPASFNVNKGDTVSILITEYNDPADFLAGGLPMSYTKDRQEFMYQSEQMMKIEALVDNKPVELLRMIGLECPEVDILEGLRVYKFQGNNESFVEVRQKRVTGILEEIQDENLNNPDVEETKEPTTDTQPEEEATNASKKDKATTELDENSNQNTNSKNKNKNKSKHKNKVTKKRKRQTKKAKANLSLNLNININIKKKKKKKKNKRTRRRKFNLEPDTGRVFSLEPDTGRAFLLEPDTARSFLLEPDTAYGSRHIPPSYINDCFPLLQLKDQLLCNLDSLKKIVELGQALNNQPIPIPVEMDLNSYFTRYKSAAYHGMILKCRKDSSQLNYVSISTKKRFLCRKLVLQFENTPDHPEYLPFKNTKWIVRYGKAFRLAQKIRDIQVNDFRILPFSQFDYAKKSKEGYFIELKGEKEMFRFAAKPKKKKKSARAFLAFSQLYWARVQSFNDSIRHSFKNKGMDNYFQFYSLLKKVSSHRKHPCVPDSYLPACLDFYITNADMDALKESNPIPNPTDCFPFRKPDCEAQYFLDWIKYYNANRKQVQNQINELNNNLPKYFNCICGMDTTIIDPVIQAANCYKWEYADLNSVGNTITYIGLGIYNLDYVFRLDEKQVLNNPLFITNEGDTLRPCSNTTSINGNQGCISKVYSIIPNFNGLLEHKFLPRISLLKNKENILFLTTANHANKRYKCSVDMRKQDQFSGNTFLIQDITEKSKTLEGLRNELIKVD